MSLSKLTALNIELRTFVLVVCDCEFLLTKL
jgi:hypothetical protein